MNTRVFWSKSDQKTVTFCVGMLLLLDINLFLFQFCQYFYTACLCVSRGLHASSPWNKFQGLPFFHLRNIAKIRHILSQNNAEKIVHAFVTSRLDYCNSLSGCPNKTLKTLQLVQNAAAKTRKRDHITPILASLHWLPYEELNLKSFSLPSKLLMVRLHHILMSS